VVVVVAESLVGAVGVVVVARCCSGCGWVGPPAEEGVEGADVAGDEADIGF
jgi:hypothetical protein